MGHAWEVFFKIGMLWQSPRMMGILRKILKSLHVMAKVGRWASSGRFLK